jgi:hypothetical protein
MQPRLWRCFTLRATAGRSAHLQRMGCALGREPTIVSDVSSPPTILSVSPLRFPAALASLQASAEISDDQVSAVTAYLVWLRKQH